MSDLTSTLSVRIETGKAAADLLALQKGLEGAALGVAKLGREIQNHSGNIQRVLGELSKHGFGGLSKSLTAETSKVGAGMRALEREVTAAAERTGKRAGKGLADGMQASAEAGLRQVRDRLSGVTSQAAIAARNLSQLSGVNPTRSITGVPASGTLLADMLRREAAAMKAIEAEMVASRKSAVAALTAASGAVPAGGTALASMLRREAAEMDAYVAKATAAARARELVMRRGNLQAAIAASTGAGTGVSGMSSQYSDGVSAFGRVANAAAKASPAIDGSRQAMKRWSDEAKIVHDTARGAAAGIGYLWMTWGNIGAMAAGFTAVRGSIAALKEMAEVEVLLTKASRESGVEFDGMRERMMKMYSDGIMPMMTGPKEVAQQLKDLVYAGFSADEAFTMLGTSLKFAAVGELEASDAAQVLQQTIHAFNLTADDSGRIADVMAKAAAASATDVGSMASAMRQAVTVGALYNASVEDTATSLAVLAKAGIEGSAAGTALKRFMDELASPKTNKAKEAIKQLGVEVFTFKDGVRQLKPLAGIVDEMRDKFQALSKTDAKAFFDLVDKMQDERGKKFFSLAVKMDQSEWDEFLNTIDKESKGFVDGMYATLSNTTQGIFQQVGAQLRASMQGGLKGADEAIKQLGQSLLTLVTSTGFKEFLSSSVTLLASLTSFLVDHGRTILSVAAAYASFRVASGAVQLLTGKLTGFIGLLARLGAVAMTPLASMRTFGQTLTTVSAGSATTAAGLVGLRGALALLGGPLGVIAGLLTAGITLWSLWGESAQEAARKAKKATDDQHKASKDLLESLRRQEKEKSLGVNGSQLLQIEEAMAAEAKAMQTLKDRYKNNIGQRMSSDAQKEYDARLNTLNGLKQEYSRLKAESGAAKGGSVTPTGSTFDPSLLADTPKKPKATSPLSVKDYDADIKGYRFHLSELSRMEQAALARSRAVWDAGLSSEKAYLDERNSIRAKADEMAKAQLDTYVVAQADAAAAAESEYLKQVKEARKLGLMEDEATLNKIKSAANRIEEAWAKAAEAREQYTNRSAERSNAAALDVLAGMREKFGNPDDALAKAREMNAELDNQIERVRGLSKVTEDQNILAIEGSLRKVDGLIAEAEATQHLTGVTNEHIVALKKKRDMIAEELNEYRVSNVEKWLADTTGGGDEIGMQIERLNEQAQIMRTAVLESTRRTEEEKKNLILQITEQTNRQVADLELKRNSQMLSGASQVFSAMAGLAKGALGEHSSAYRALFAISKAFTITQATMELHGAMVKALNSGPWPTNMAAMAQVASAGAGLISAITSSNFSGAYDGGGDIPLGKFGLVGERGPELVQGPVRVTSRVETARMAREGSAPATPPVVNVKNVNVLDPAIVGDYLSTDAGERLIMNVVQRNKRSLAF